MKIRASLFLLILFIAISSPGQTTKGFTKAKKRYELRSIFVRYLITGDAQGTRLFRFTDYGRLERIDEDYTYRLYTLKEEKHTTQLRRNDTVYAINRKTGATKKEIDQLTNKLLSYKTPYEAITSFWINDGGEIIEQDTLLGLPVTHWEFPGGTITKLWEWKGIPIKYNKKLGSLIYQVSADEIDSTSTLPKHIFILPDSLAGH